MLSSKKHFTVIFKSIERKTLICSAVNSSDIDHPISNQSDQVISV
jgi:hypothetical protein